MKAAQFHMVHMMAKKLRKSLKVTSKQSNRLIIKKVHNHSKRQTATEGSCSQKQVEKTLGFPVKGVFLGLQAAIFGHYF